MVNFNAINESPINTSPENFTQNLDDISFDGYGLDNDSIIVSAENFWMRDIRNRDVSLLRKLQANGEIFNSAFFAWKQFSVNGILYKDTQEELNDLIDEFNIRMTKEQGILRWVVNGEARYIRATINEITYGEKDCNIIPFTISFSSTDGFWIKEQKESIIESGVTSFPFPVSIQNAGIEVSPTIVVVFQDADSVTEFTCKIDDIGATITQAISTGDILVIDSLNSSMLLNNVEIDFGWVFPRIERGLNLLQFWITGTSAEIDFSISYDVNIP